MSFLRCSESLPDESQTHPKPTELLLDFVMGEPLRKRYEASKGDPDPKELLTDETIPENSLYPLPAELKKKRSKNKKSNNATASSSSAGTIRKRKRKKRGEPNIIQHYYRPTCYQTSLIPKEKSQNDKMKADEMKLQQQRLRRKRPRKSKPRKMPTFMTTTTSTTTKTVKANDDRANAISDDNDSQQEKEKQETTKEATQSNTHDEPTKDDASLSPIIQVLGRRVNLDRQRNSSPSLYSLLRSWVQDEPHQEIPPPRLTQYSLWAYKTDAAQKVQRIKPVVIDDDASSPSSPSGGAMEIDGDKSSDTPQKDDAEIDPTSKTGKTDKDDVKQMEPGATRAVEMVTSPFEETAKVSKTPSKGGNDCSEDGEKVVAKPSTAADNEKMEIDGEDAVMKEDNSDDAVDDNPDKMRIDDAGGKVVVKKVGAKTRDDGMDKGVSKELGDVSRGEPASQEDDSPEGKDVSEEAPETEDSSKETGPIGEDYVPTKPTSRDEMAVASTKDVPSDSMEEKNAAEIGSKEDTKLESTPTHSDNEKEKIRKENSMQEDAAPDGKNAATSDDRPGGEDNAKAEVVEGSKDDSQLGPASSRTHESADAAMNEAATDRRDDNASMLVDQGDTENPDKTNETLKNPEEKEVGGPSQIPEPLEKDAATPTKSAGGERAVDSAAPDVGGVGKVQDKNTSPANAPVSACGPLKDGDRPDQNGEDTMDIFRILRQNDSAGSEKDSSCQMEVPNALLLDMLVSRSKQAKSAASKAHGRKMADAKRSLRKKGIMLYSKTEMRKYRY